MTASELIEKLKVQVEEHDDLEIGFVNGETGEEFEVCFFDTESGMIVGR